MARRLLTAALLVAASLTVVGPLASPATAAPASPSVAAPASSGVNDFSCRPSAEHPRPVVMLHGLGAPSGEANWFLHAPAVARAGYCVFTPTYGVNDYGAGGFDPIDESSAEIARYLDRVLTATGASKVDLVGHSEGGFQSLYVPKLTAAKGKVGRVVALAPPTHGTTLSGLVTLGQALGGQSLVNAITQGVLCFACSDLVKGSDTVDRLVSTPIAQPGVTYTVIATRSDLVVTPPSTGFVREPGVTNYYVQDKCPLDPVGHVGIVADTGITSMILNGLDPSKPVRCGLGPIL